MATGRSSPGERVASPDGTADATRQKVSDRRWQEIVDVAAEIIRDRGYHATSIQDVADRVGMLKGSLYYYIETKEDLLFAVLAEGMRGANALVEEVAAVEGDAVTKIRAFIEAHLTYDVDHLPKIAVFHHEHRALTGERAEALRAQRHDYVDFVEGLIDQGKDEGLFRPDLDTSLAARGLLGMMNWVYRWYRPTGRYQAPDIAATFADLFLGGLASDAARRDGLAGAVGERAAAPDET